MGDPSSATNSGLGAPSCWEARSTASIQRRSLCNTLLATGCGFLRTRKGRRAFDRLRACEKSKRSTTIPRAFGAPLVQFFPTYVSDRNGSHRASGMGRSSIPHRSSCSGKRSHRDPSRRRAKPCGHPQPGRREERLISEQQLLKSLGACVLWNGTYELEVVRVGTPRNQDVDLPERKHSF